MKHRKKNPIFYIEEKMRQRETAVCSFWTKCSFWPQEMPAKIASFSIHNFLNYDSLGEEYFLMNRRGQEGQGGTTGFVSSSLCKTIFCYGCLLLSENIWFKLARLRWAWLKLCRERCFLDRSVCSGHSCHHSPPLHLVLSFTLPLHLDFSSRVEDKWDVIGTPPLVSATCRCVVWGTVWTSQESLAFIQLCCHLSVSFSDWWPPIIYVISVFITKRGSVMLSHLEWLYVLTTLFPDNKLPLWTAPSLPWFSFWRFFCPSQNLSTSLAFR